MGLVYPDGELEGAMTRETFEALPAETRRRYSLVVGHFPFGLHRRIPRPSRYVTVVRDPVERVVSLYYHFRNLPGIRFGGKGHRERLRMRLGRVTLEKWVFGSRRLGVDNQMVRNISGSRSAPFGGCTDAMLKQALANIDQHFAAVLVTEEMDRSAIVLSRVIGRQLPRVGYENANPRRPPLNTIDPTALDSIRELNRFDLQLYDHALRSLRQTSSTATDGETLPA